MKMATRGGWGGCISLHGTYDDQKEDYTSLVHSCRQLLYNCSWFGGVGLEVLPELCHPPLIHPSVCTSVRANNRNRNRG